MLCIFHSGWNYIYCMSFSLSLDYILKSNYMFLSWKYILKSNYMFLSWKYILKSNYMFFWKLICEDRTKKTIWTLLSFAVLNVLVLRRERWSSHITAILYVCFTNSCINLFFPSKKNTRRYLKVSTCFSTLPLTCNMLWVALLKRNHISVVLVLRNPLNTARVPILIREVMIGHNSWTDWAREPVKTSLDEEDNKASNVLDKKIYLYLWHFWEISIFMHVPYLIFGNFQRK